MKIRLLVLLTFFLSSSSYSQITFEKGYYINNSGHRIKGFIKNADWKNNPSEFEYKQALDSEQKKINIKEAQEFGVYDVLKYKRYTLDIDRSSENLDRLSTSKDPVFNKEQLFLKVLIEGTTGLFLYEDGDLKRYFFKSNEQDIEQLIFKSYLLSDNKIRTNNKYKKQLWSMPKCPDISLKNIRSVGYTKDELIQFFETYNNCHHSEFINYEKKPTRDLFNLSIRPGLNRSILSINNSTPNYRDTDFNPEISFRIGLETEFLLSFNKNKWAIILEPTFQYYKTRKESLGHELEVDYKSIELPLGIRHYLFLNEDSKLFINGLYVFDWNLNSIITVENGGDLEIRTKNSLAFGIGYNYKKYYSIELRYQTPRDVLNSYVTWHSNYNTISIILGYSIF